MNKQQQLESVFDALIDLVLKMADKEDADCYDPESIPAIVEQIIHLQPLVPKERDFATNLCQGEVESAMPYVKRLKVTVDPVSKDLREAIKNTNGLMLIEDLALRVIRLITENNLTVKQVNALLECVQAEVKECCLSRF